MTNRIIPTAVSWDEPPVAQHLADLIYSRKYGTALTMDVFIPVKQNGAAIIVLDSGGWVSEHKGIWVGSYKPYLTRGYTVFTPVHASVPRFAVPDAVADISRAVRFIRYYAKDFGVDPNRLGITGSSAGGQLSLMMGTAYDAGDPASKDWVERQSNRVQAVAVFCPPSDFTDESYVAKTWDLEGLSPMSFIEKVDLPNGKKRTQMMTDPARRAEVYKQISPLLHVSKDSAPTMIIHGDADERVPLDQSKRLKEKFESVGVPTKLVITPGGKHYDPEWLAKSEQFADWFDQYLSESPAAR